MEDLERIKERLDNIRSVEPILAALRTIAAGSWHVARNRLSAARLFADELLSILRILEGHLSSGALQIERRDPVRTVGMLVIASERGLAGAFNSTVLQAAERYLAAQHDVGRQVVLMTLGARAQTHFVRRGVALAHSWGLPVTTVASLSFVQGLYRQLRSEYDVGRYDLLYVVYTPYQPRGSSRPVLAQLWPLTLPEPEEEIENWPPPVVDTEPALLQHEVLEQWGLVELYRTVIESAASEQSARFRTLDGATSNSQRLIEELTQSYHAARQHAITLEMLDLVAGSGLLSIRRNKRSD